MLTITYASTSAPSAKELKRCLEKIIGDDEEIRIVKANIGDINWGRSGNIQCEYAAGLPLNSVIDNSTDKLTMRILFLKHKVPAPKLLELREAYEFVETGHPVLARTRTHTRRKGFYLCRTPKDIEKAIAGGCVQFLEYIENVVREYRVHIFCGRSIRLNQKSWTNTAHTKYTTIPADKAIHGAEVKRVREVAKQAVAALGLAFGAVDVIVAPDGRVLVCEVNAAPGLGGTTGMAYAEAIKKWWME